MGHLYYCSCLSSGPRQATGFQLAGICGSFVLVLCICSLVLGRQLGFSNPHELEIESRISQAWRKFYKFKQELTGSRYPLADRLRLFHGTVTPTILYGCEAWTMTVPGTSYLVPGTGYLVPGNGYQTPWYRVQGTWYQVPGARYMVPGTR